MSDSTSLEKDYAQSFWTVANAIAAFSIVQSLTFMLAVGPHTSDLAKTIAHQRPLVFVSIAIGTALYVGLVGYCQWANWRLLGAPKISPVLAAHLRYWNRIRLVAVALAGVSNILPIFSLVAQ
jgi:hypothetical protein